ncbi:MAG: uracil-DNA glycosylase [Bradymonadia bacterium]
MSDRAELARLVAAARGAVAWMQESGELALPIPEGFDMPPLGRIAPRTPPKRRPAPQNPPAPVARVAPAATSPGPSAPASPGAPTEASLSQMPSMSTWSTLGVVEGEHIVLPGEGGRPALVATGPQPARLMFLGEPHTEQPPEPLEPFHGAAGTLLHKMIRAMGLSVADVALVNLLEGGGTRWCREHLAEAVQAFQPEVIVAMGVFPARSLLDVRASMARMRGRWHTYGEGPGRPVMVTFPPGLLLKHPDLKRPVWGDLKKVMSRLNLEIPKKRS